MGQEANFPLVVVDGAGPNLFGRDWLHKIGLDWRAICVVQRRRLVDILEENEEVF